jgi:hypothetical protein
MAKKKASEDMFNELHNLVTTEFLQRIKSGEASTQDLKAACDWLAKNDISGIAYEGNPLDKLATVMPKLTLKWYSGDCMAQKTSDYYKSNPEAAAKRRKQQRAYNKTNKGLKIRTAANKLNRKLGTYGNGDGKDASHTGKNTGKLETPSSNRRRPRTGKKYA